MNHIFPRHSDEGDAYINVPRHDNVAAWWAATLVQYVCVGLALFTATWQMRQNVPCSREDLYISLSFGSK